MSYKKRIKTEFGKAFIYKKIHPNMEDRRKSRRDGLSQNRMQSDLPQHKNQLRFY